MKHWTIAGFIAVALVGSPSAAFSNNFHIVLNGFSQEVHASDGYTGVLGTNARTLSWWYRSHVNSFPSVWGVVHWGQHWTVQVVTCLVSSDQGFLENGLRHAPS